MGGRIEAYLDISSFYSYLAFVELMRGREKLRGHGVEVDIHPVLLGAINSGSGNKPPWSLPAKGKHLQFDLRRSKDRLGKPEITPPKDLLSMAMTVAPLRALWYIKRNYPEHVYYTAMHYLYDCFWTPPNRNVSNKDVLREALAEAPRESPTQLGTPEEKLFGLDEVDRIMKGAETDEAKAAIKGSTQEALDRGAYGAPWFWVTDAEGKGEPFFGSDRFHFIYRYLGVPFRDIELLAPGEAKGKGAKL